MCILCLNLEISSGGRELWPPRVVNSIMTNGSVTLDTILSNSAKLIDAIALIVCYVVLDDYTAEFGSYNLVLGSIPINSK